MTATASDTLFIDNVHTLVQALVAWHDNKVQILEHMMTIPSGTEMLINDTDTVVLDGEALKGFCAGITVALSELGNLPFDYSVDPEPVSGAEASNDNFAQADADDPAAATQPVH